MNRPDFQRDLPPPPSLPAAPAADGDPAAVSRSAPQRWAAVLIPLLAVLLGGATARWSEGLVLLAIGTFAVVAPPRFSAGRMLNLVLVALILLAGTAFLPARWFALPGWRVALGEDFGITLPATLSPQPILAAESCLLGLAGIVWFYLMLTFHWKAEGRRAAGRVFAGGAIAIAGIALFLHRLDLMPPSWHNERRFGPFPNRNQTADFFALGSVIILAVAHLCWQEKRRAEATAWMVGWGAVLLAIFHSYSRAGIVMLFGLVGVYLLIEIRRSAQRHTRARGKRSGESEDRLHFSLLDPAVRWTAVGLSLAMLLAGFFFLFGGRTLERFLPSGDAGSVEHPAGKDFRVRVQRDAARMVDASPWCGVGIGSFSEVFPFFRRESAQPERSIHPESDYLWLAGEMGWPVLVLVAAGVTLVALPLGRSVRVTGSGHDRRLRLAAVIAVAAFAAHGLVDVSAHRLGTVLSACFLLGIASKYVPAGETSSRSKVRWYARPPGAFAPLERAIFRAGGGLLAAGGLVFLLESTGVVLLPGQTAVDALRERMKEANAAGKYVVEEASATRLLGWAPLDWEGYFRRASARLRLGGDRDGIADDFRRARHLEPFRGELPQVEGKLWLAAGENSLAIAALGEACRRVPSNTELYVGEAMGAAGKRADFLDELAAYTRRNPAMLAAFLTYSDTPRTPDYITAALAADPELERLSTGQKTIFFRSWAQRGDAAALCEAMKTRPAWQAAGWRWWAAGSARVGQPETACDLAVLWSPRPTLPPAMPTAMPADELRRHAASQPPDPILALQAYRAMSAAGEWANALTALERVTSEKDCPPYFHFLQADAAGKLSDWPSAWKSWDRYLGAARIQDK